MNIPCPNSITCPDDQLLSNYTSEAPDPAIFFTIPLGNGIVNLLGGGSGGPISPPDGGPAANNTVYSARRGCAGDPYLDTFNFGGVQPITFAVVSGVIPSFVSAQVSGSTLTLSGTSTYLNSGTSAFSVMATDAIGETQTKNFGVDILGLSSNPMLPQFNSNTGYSTQLQSAGGTGGYTYGILSGALPAGLTLSNTGLISGTPIVATGSFPFTLSIRDAGGRLCFQNMQFAFNPVCQPSIAPVLDTTFALSGDAVIYASFTDTIWLLNGNTNIMQVVNPATGVVNSSFVVAFGQNVDSMAYDSTQHRVYVVYSTNTPQVRVLVLDEVLFTTVTDILLSGTQQFGGDMKYDSVTNKMWVQQDHLGDGVWVINCGSFAVTSLALPANFSSTQGIGIGGGFAIIGGRLPNVQHVGVWKIDSNSLTSLGVIDLAPTFDTVEGIDYSPQTGRFYVAISNHGFYSFDPVLNGSVLIPQSGFDQSGCKYHSCRQQVMCFNGFGGADQLKAFYISGISTVSNTVMTSVSPSTFPFPCTNAAFDPTRARMWFASGSTLCRFT